MLSAQDGRLGGGLFQPPSEALLRAKFLLVGGLVLLLGACTAKVSHDPPPLNKQLLTGKWKNSSESQFITGYEFAENGDLKMTVKGLEKPVPGGYTWSGERTLELKFKITEDSQKAYQTAAKAYKDGVKARIKAGELTDRAGPSILGTVPDDLPAEETLRVSLAEKPRLLILVRADGGSQTFELAE
jgi:hypothetical protein